MIIREHLTFGRAGRRGPLTRALLACALLGSALYACGDDAAADDGAAGQGGSGSPQCDAPDGYIAFDTANHVPQDRRLAAHAEMVALMASAVAEDGSVDGSKFGEALDLYTDAVESAELQAKVQGRKDEHVAGDPLVGDRIDATITSWLEAATDAQTARQANVARQWVDKSLQEFFFLSVHHEILIGARDKWDEGFGYYGSGSSNAEADLAGLALTAFKRDTTNGTSLGAEVFNAYIDGACSLDEALGADDALDVSDDAALSASIETIDGNLQLVLAYSAGHEAFEMAELLDAADPDADELFVKAAELEAFLIPLERIMNDAGGASKSRAEELRSLLDPLPGADPDAADLEDEAWIENLDAQRFIEIIEEEFGIEIKG